MKLTIHRFFFWCHLIVGVVFGVLIFVKAVTGICLAFQNQLVDWSEKDRRVVEPPSPKALRLMVADIVGRAQATNPEQKASGVTVKSDPTASVAVNFGRDGETVYVNPYTGDILGKNSELHDALRSIEEFHRWFGFRNGGKQLSATATLGFFLLALSGIYLWWPSAWTTSKVKSITVFNGNLSGKARDWNWHNVTGFWMSPFLILITVTGLIMSSAPGPAQRGGDHLKHNESMDEKPMLSVDQLLEHAEGQVLSWVSISLRFPPKPGGPVTAQILESKPSIGLPARSQATLDASTGEIKKWEPFSEATSDRKLRAWARYLHTGEAGGVIGQFLAMLAAVGALLLVWTGFAMAWRRFT